MEHDTKPQTASCPDAGGLASDNPERGLFVERLLSGIAGLVLLSALARFLLARRQPPFCNTPQSVIEGASIHDTCEAHPSIIPSLPPLLVGLLAMTGVGVRSNIPLEDVAIRYE